MFALTFNSIGMLGILLASFYIFGKSIKYPASIGLKMLTVLWCIFWTFLAGFNITWMPPLMLRLLFSAVSIIYILVLTKVKWDSVISAFLFSLGFSYSLYYIAAALVGAVFGIFMIEDMYQFVPGAPLDFYQPILFLLYSVIAVFQLISAVLIFRIKRFRNGFPFLFERYAVILALITAGAVLVLVTWLSIASFSENDAYAVFLFMAGVLIIGVGIFIWIRRGIKLFQRKQIKERNEELLLREVDELKAKLKQSESNNDILRIANHSISHRLAAMLRINERVLKKGYEYNVPAEFSDDLAIAVADIRKLAGEYVDSLSSVEANKELPTTNIQTLDEMFRLFSDKFAADNIFFKLKVNGSIIHMTENVVPLGRLETLVGDHLQDALIAIGASNSAPRSVMALLGEVGDYYGFSVYDSGIPFDIDTLARLGIERVTTHADSGGSGVGFMQTFATMGECGASLIIKEIRPGGAFSKAVTVRFDGQSQYIIDSYRACDVPASERYVVIGNE